MLPLNLHKLSLLQRFEVKVYFLFIYLKCVDVDDFQSSWLKVSIEGHVFIVD